MNQNQIRKIYIQYIMNLDTTDEEPQVQNFTLDSNQSIFSDTKNFKFTQNDSKATSKFQQMITQAISQMPVGFYTSYNLQYVDLAKQTKLFKKLKTIPKGCLHHIHFQCTQDQIFYRDHVINDPLVYLTQDMKNFKIGTKQQAKQNKWTSMQQARQQFDSDQIFLKYITSITTFNNQQLQQCCKNPKLTWQIFQSKILAFYEIFQALHIFRKYVKHFFIKYVKNGYDRIQSRIFLYQLRQYDTNGVLIKIHGERKFMDVVDEVFKEVKEQYPSLTIGFIFQGLKESTDQQNYKMFSQICQLNWEKTIGVDFVQEEDLYGDLQPYDDIINKVFTKYPNTGYKKVYHAGQTRDHLNRNIQVAVKAGSVRIGHGLNILQRSEFLPHCKNVCFQSNPISNLVLGYHDDTKLSSAPVLLGLGYPVTINPDDPGKFGLQDTTMDYFVAACSYPWTLKHLKLIAIHSINHSICSQQIKDQLLLSFNQKWDKWVQNLLKEDQTDYWNPVKQDLSMYTYVRNWSFSQQQISASKKFIDLVHKTASLLPADFLKKNNFIHYLKQMKQSQLFKLLKNIPKSVLQYNQFDCNQDFEFYKNHVVNDQNLYLDQERKQFKYGTKEFAQENNWISMKKLRLGFQNQDEFVQYVTSFTIFSQKELQQFAGKYQQTQQQLSLKVKNFKPIISNLKFFKPYVKHVFIRFINNNYDRVQLRTAIMNLKQYDPQGKLIKVHPYKKFIEVIDEVFKEVNQIYPYFTVGFIFQAVKHQSDQLNQKMLEQICSLQWNKTIGFDFVRQQENHNSLQKYDSLIDKVLKKHPYLDYKKIYHLFESKDQNNKNLEVAIKSGSVRIGDGVNVLQKIEFLVNENNICFEGNISSNLLLSHSGENRCRQIFTLLSLGFAVTINGINQNKFRLQDTTSDLFLSAVVYKWGLKDLKLIFLHAINHSICSTGQKILLQQKFEQKWKKWIVSLLRYEHKN